MECVYLHIFVSDMHLLNVHVRHATSLCNDVYYLCVCFGPFVYALSVCVNTALSELHVDRLLSNMCVAQAY